MKLHIKRGLPGSGKTTESLAMVAEHGNTGRVNRDDIRAMVFGSVWTQRREEIVVDIEKAIVKVLFEHNNSAIIDDTNLTEKHLNLWKSYGQQLGFKEIRVDTLVGDVDKAVAGDLGRQKYVGKAVIHKMALNAGLIDFGDKPIVIVDLDGTCCDGAHREAYLEDKSDSLRWQKYFAACGQDAPIEFVINMVRALAEDHTICIVSGRPDTYQNQTMEWLKKHGVPYAYLFMRSGGDKRPDVQVKTDILKKLPKSQILCALDDRPIVIREVWRKHGVRVIPVRGACDEF